MKKFFKTVEVKKKPTVAYLVLKALKKHGPIPCAELAEIMGKSLQSTNYQLKCLRAEKMAYVSGHVHRQVSGKDAQIWAVGNKPDVKKPKVVHERAPVEAKTPARKRTAKEIQEEHEQEQDASRRARLLSQITVRRDPLVEAFFGSATQ
jgi:Winged helix-turn-helix DNA-binding